MKQKLEGAYLAEREKLLGWMESRIGREEAEDALQEVLLGSLGSLDTLAGMRDLAAWLWRGARNAVIDVWRKRARRKTSSEADGIDLELFMDSRWEDADDSLEQEELLNALMGAIDKLPPEQAFVIRSQAIGGESFASIAARTGIPADTLASRKRYGLAGLERALRPFKED